ncbi:cell division inhibitor SulA [Alkalimarinus alittae]|uniref:SulA-like leucine-rich domain-containing protein n=1 Tax=Alkalimarinus alittae TaxID=2961619 RepID=A0ABY6MYH6_9ALTE|nr:SulA-like leucine-rich domain-containing protein [Alkalimarinus alittae]UZE94832.1 SulA-like leucine-rich domain-containing protein [Alkalimarinus alittae]
MKQMSFYDEQPAIEPEQGLYAVEDNAAELAVALQAPAQTATAPSAGNVTEIILSPEQAENFQMLLPMMTQLNQENRWLAWIDPPQSLLNRWQQQSGIIANQIMILRSTESKSTLDLTLQALSAGTCHAVIAWTNKLTKNDFRLLEAASAKGSSHGLVMRYR